MIYLDYAATTPVDPLVLEAMLPYFTEHFGNASSRLHAYGWKAEKAVKHARKTMADLLNLDPKEIFFNSGSTEGINLVLKGISHPTKNKIITLRTEHKASLDTCKILASKSREICFAKLNENGQVDLQDLRSQIDDKTLMVSIMAVNNETGLIQDLESIGQICKENKVYFFCDASQAIGKIPIDIQKWKLDAMAISAHKFYGPKGIGALYLNKSIKKMMQAQITGGGQEYNLRSGTQNVPSIVGMCKAFEIAFHLLPGTTDQNNTPFIKLNKILRKGLDEISTIKISYNTDHQNSVPHILNVQMGDLNSEHLLDQLNHRLCLSNGSACNSAEVLPSHVLLAMGKTEREANSSIRFSLGRQTTENEISQAIQLIYGAIDTL